MFITAVCVLFLNKLRWPRNKSLYHHQYHHHHHHHHSYNRYIRNHRNHHRHRHHHHHHNHHHHYHHRHHHHRHHVCPAVSLFKIIACLTSLPLYVQPFLGLRLLHVLPLCLYMSSRVLV